MIQHCNIAKKGAVGMGPYCWMFERMHSQNQRHDVLEVAFALESWVMQEIVSKVISHVLHHGYQSLAVPIKYDLGAVCDGMATAPQRMDGPVGDKSISTPFVSEYVWSFGCSTSFS